MRHSFHHHHTLLHLFKIVTGVLVKAIEQEKDIEGITIGGKDIKRFLFAEIILCIGNPTTATKILLELINEFGKVAGYKAIPQTQ